MAKAKEVARYLAHIAVTDEEADYPTNLRLHKLLYYAQAWSIVMRRKALFPERIEAWVHGPVVRAVYNAFGEKGSSPILEQDIGPPSFKLTKEEQAFIHSVWDTYKGYSVSKLREMTHREDPWVNARKGHGPGERCDEEITANALREYFTSPNK